MSDATLNQIEVNQIAPRPDNPRLVMRADVVDASRPTLTASFQQSTPFTSAPSTAGIRYFRVTIA